MSTGVFGTVLHGEARGRELGFPTVNIELKEVMESGVWSGEVNIVLKGEKKHYIAAVFVHPGKKLLEAHLLDFSQDVYGQAIEVKLIKKIRDSRQFDSKDELKKQIAKDVAEIRRGCAV